MYTMGRRNDVQSLKIVLWLLSIILFKFVTFLGFLQGHMSINLGKGRSSID